MTRVIELSDRTAQKLKNAIDALDAINGDDPYYKEWRKLYRQL